MGLVDDTDFLTTDEVARIFHVDRRTVTRWLGQHRIHGTRLPTVNDRGQWRIPLSEITRLVRLNANDSEYWRLELDGLEDRIRAELHAAADEIEPDPGALAKIQDRTGGNST